MSNFTMELHDFELGLLGEPPAACWCSAPVFSAQFTFDWQTANKELMDLTVWGPFVLGRTREFAKEVDRHAEWSDARVTEALNEAGAKFGPDHRAEFVRALPLEKLEPFMGGPLDVVSAEFYVRPSTSKEAHPAWIVQAKWHSPDGRLADCPLVFEPFEGKLQSIFRTPLPPNAGGEPK
jgi:hypothetical protein